MDNEIIERLREFIGNSVADMKGDGIVIGMSGGKDSLVTAKLCVDAIGPGRVLGVIMPNGEMSDLEDAKKSCELLGMDYKIVDIAKLYAGFMDIFSQIVKEISSGTQINVTPRIRMSILYGIAQSKNYLVANTSNLSEKMVGYTTKWGDNVGDFSVLSNFTASEVVKIGHMLGLPVELVEKTPSDGLTGLSDEESFGFTYKELDELIREGKRTGNYSCIIAKRDRSRHKREGLKEFKCGYKNYLEEIK